MSQLEKQFERTKPGDLGIIGDPVEHSLSPDMQNAALKTWRMAFEDRELVAATYHKFHVTPSQLSEAIQLMRKYRLRGLNVTVPHKISVGSYLQEWEGFAKKMGSVNTLVLENDVLKGFNTDGDGFRRAVERDMNLDMEGNSALVLGVGGTGRVVAYQLEVMGASHVYIWNRSVEKCQALLKEFEHADSFVSIVSSPAEMQQALKQSKLIINATSVGLAEDDGLPAPDLSFQSDHFVFDVIYHRETAFMKKAREQGAQVFSGESMLLYQGARAFEIWTGTPAPHDLMRSVLHKLLKG